MDWLHELNLNQFLVFTLVLTRTSGLVTTAPVYGGGEVPARIRGFLAVALALVIAPTQFHSVVSTPASTVDYLFLAGSELLIGFTLGLGVQILFVAAQVGGQLVSQIGGISLADVFNPTLETEIPLFSQLLYMFTLAIFLTIGGHRLVMSGLLSTFQSIPLGSVALGASPDGLPSSISDALSTLVTQSLELGVRFAAPATTALLLATVIMGLISRTVPQLNIMAVGFGINALVTLGALSLSLGAIAWTFEAQIEPFIETLLAALKER